MVSGQSHPSHRGVRRNRGATHTARFVAHARLGEDGRLVHLGTFATIAEAAAAYDRAILRRTSEDDPRRSRLNQHHVCTCNNLALSSENGAP